jgi:hypothetical protein
MLINPLLQLKKEKEESLLKKREEAERKARRGEIDPTHEFTFHIIGQVRGLLASLPIMSSSS